MKKYFALLATLIWTVNCLQAQDIQPYERNGFGVTVETDFKVGNAVSPKVDPSDYRYFSITANAFYNWHPCTNSSEAAKPFYVRPQLGFGFLQYNTTNEPMFTLKVLAGYTFKVKNVGIDVLTGPAGKWGTRSRGDMKWDVNKRYNGFVWFVGAGVLYKHFGVNIGYNIALNNFEHHRYYGNNPTIQHSSIPGHKTMTAALLYYF